MIDDMEDRRMLVLSRKLGERIQIETPSGEVIWVSVVDIRRGKVRLGVTAPKDVVVVREELLPENER